MSRRSLLLAALAALALLALLVWSFAPRPVEVELDTVALRDFETTIDEDARTRLRDRYVVSAPLAGRLQRIGLREGDAVQAGDVVATLTPLLSPMLDQRSLQQQQAQIGAAEAGVQRAAALVASVRASRDRARADLRRTEQLAQQGFVAPTKIDADRLTALAAQKDHDAAVEGLHVAEHELAQARAALASAQGGPGQAAFELRAPVAGRVLKVHQPSEATVGLGAPIMDIGDTSRLEVVAELLSSDALLAQPGRRVRIERWGGPAALQGQVRSIEPAAFTKISALGVEEQRVNVLIDITSPASEWAALGDGYRVGVRIVTRSEQQVPCVPVSAVFPLPQTLADIATTMAAPRPMPMPALASASASASAAAFAPASAPSMAPTEDLSATTSTTRAAVFVFEGGRARIRPVEIAARNASMAWVPQGLEPGTRVIVYPPTTLADGARVAARKR